MPTSTTNFGLSKPLVNDPTDQDLWGGELNTDLDSIDGLMLTAFNWTKSNKTASFNVTAPTSGSTTTGSAKILFTCDATSGAITATMCAPASAGNGFSVAIKKTDSSAHTITINPNASETFDGASSLTINNQYDSYILACDGTNWQVLTKPIPAATTPTLKQQVFTSTGANTFTAPSNTVSGTVFKFTITAGGGQGGGGASANYGCGGGAGGTAIWWVSGLTANTGYTCTVGAGGTTGTTGTGQNGSNSTVVINATTVTANGGVGGASGGTSTAGGTCTNGSINITGGSGGGGMLGGTYDMGGYGGGSFWGSGGAGVSTTSTSNGIAATAYGAGGGGGTGGSSVTGGVGANGIITVEWIL